MKKECKYSESLLRSMMESPDNLLIWAVDRKYRYLFFNNPHKIKMKQFWNADIELGENLLSYIHDPDYIKLIREQYEKVFTNWSGVSTDKLVDSEGNVEYFDNYGNPVYDKNGEVVGIVLYTMEVTDRVLAEKELERISVTDKLTSLFNRNRIDDTLEREFFRAERYDRPFSIIMMDIDNFKAVNDTYGHIAGDEVLVKLAELLIQNTRTVDTSGRWGGEEFLMICPETDAEEAAGIADKIRQIIEKAIFPSSLKLTCSFGVTMYEKESTLTELVEKADRALYKAKKNGKNQVCSEIWSGRKTAG